MKDIVTGYDEEYDTYESYHEEATSKERKKKTNTKDDRDHSHGRNEMTQKEQK